MLLSVIVPIYNKAPFLRKFFESVVNQGLNRDEFEILLINDGSTDESELICKDFISENPGYRIEYIYQDNAGVSAARNRGIELAKGEYIHFIDCDDCLYRQSYHKILESACHLKPDYIGFGMALIDCRVENESEIPITELPEGRIYKNASGLNLIEDTSWPSSCVVGLYRRNFIISKDIRFPKGISIGEDVWFNFDFFSKNPICLLTTFRPYIYYQRPGSAIMNTSTETGERWFHSYHALLSYLTIAANNSKHKDSIQKVIDHHIKVFIPRALQAGLPNRRFTHWANVLRASDIRQMGGG